MKKHTVALFVALFSLCFIRGYAAPNISAQSAILIEKNSGRVLYEKNASAKLPMASTTKIITAITAIENEDISLDSVCEISENAANTEGSSMYLEAGEKLTLRELLYGLMLSSGNDAAVAIAEAVSGSQEEFAKLMCQKAREVGAKDSNFTNPNGLPDDAHYSTAADMAKLTSYAMSNSDFAEIVSTKNINISGEGKSYPRSLSNHNKLLSMYEGCIGVKTGFTKSAGRCLVSSAKRDNMTLICVTLNAPDDWSDHIQLLDYGYDNYEYKKIISCDIPVCSVSVSGAEETETDIYAGSDVHFPLCEGEGYRVETEIYPGISAPLKKGEQVGRAIIEMSGRKAEIPLVVRNEVKSEAVTKKLGELIADSIKRVFVSWTAMMK